MAKKINFIRPQEVYDTEKGESKMCYTSYDGSPRWVRGNKSPNSGEAVEVEMTATTLAVSKVEEYQYAFIDFEKSQEILEVIEPQEFSFVLSSPKEVLLSVEVTLGSSGQRDVEVTFTDTTSMEVIFSEISAFDNIVKLLGRGFRATLEAATSSRTDKMWFNYNWLDTVFSGRFFGGAITQAFLRIGDFQLDAQTIGAVPNVYFEIANPG